MKLVLGLAVATVIVLIPSSAKAEWMYVTSANNRDVFVEDASINNRGDRIDFWQMDVLGIPFKGKAKRVVTNYALSCSRKTMTTVASTPYNRNGKPLTDPTLASTPGKTENIMPGTVGHAIQQMVCGN